MKIFFYKYGIFNLDEINVLRRLPWTLLLIFFPIAFLVACSKNVNNPGYEFQISVGEQFVRSGDYERGYRILEKVSEKNPNAASVQLALAESFFEQRAYLKAQSHYDQVIQLGETVEGKIGKARIALAQNDAKSAIEMFNVILVDEPMSLIALNGMGVAYDLLGQHEIAQNYYKQVLTHNTDDVAAINNIALSKTMNGNRAEGERLLSTLLLSTQDKATVRQNTAFVKAINGKTDKAQVLFGLDLVGWEINHNINVARRLAQFL